MPALAWSSLVFALGFHALAAQTLLFRSFLSSFEGSELGIGCFFGSWLIWVGLGALLARAAARRVEFIPRNFALLSLLHLPAFVLQFYLIENIRALAGVLPYELFPLVKMVSVSFLANAPVSLMTGFLFTAACVAAPKQGSLPVARVYVLEALGGFAGGVAITVLLSAGVAGMTVFLACAALLAAAASSVSLGGRNLAAPATLAAAVVALAAGAGGAWSEANGRAAWERLLPPGTYAGSFTTSQGRYLFGGQGNRTEVMAWGGVVETLPDPESASEVVALHLSQHPAARNVLYFGPGGLAVCRRFRKIPGIDSVTWVHPDPEFPAGLSEALPDLPGNYGRIDADFRSFLETYPDRFDVIVLNLPDVTSLVLNRYATQEFFRKLKQSLSPGGVLSVRMSGGENYLGGELAYLGASMLWNLERVFSNVALKPGEETWLFCSDGTGLTTEPALLRDRFSAIPGAPKIYPPEGLLGLYPPERLRYQMRVYRETIARMDAAILVNTANDPKALLYGLAAGLRRAGVRGLSHRLPVLQASLFWIFACGVLLYVLLRALYLLRGSAPPAPRGFDASALVFTTGLAGMAMGVVLMFLYQSRFGSLYLHVGLVSSLFMFGLFAGGLLSGRALRAMGREPAWFLPAAAALHMGLLLWISALPPDATHTLYILLFGLAGAVTGAYFPIAAHLLQEEGRSVAASGAGLEFVDHLGGAAGAVLCGLALLPICGTHATIALLAVVTASNVVPGLLPARGSPATDAFERVSRPGAYWLLGAAAFLLVAAHVSAAARAGREGELFESAARLLSPGAEIERKTAPLQDGSELTYYASDDGYIFETSKLARDVQGYGGPIRMAVRVGPHGQLHDFVIIDSSETPVYLAMTAEWQEKEVAGRNLYQDRPFEHVDAVAGATLTCEGITRTLRESAHAFSTQVLGRPRPRDRSSAPLPLPSFRTRASPAFFFSPALRSRSGSRPTHASGAACSSSPSSRPESGSTSSTPASRSSPC